MKLAQDLDTIQEQGAPGFKFNSSGGIGEIVSAIIPYLFTAAGVLLLLYLVMGGLQMMTSGGDPKAMQDAKGKITNALIGFLIVFTSYWVVQIIGSLVGLQNTGFLSPFN
jgi:hypothetical protein